MDVLERAAQGGREELDDLALKVEEPHGVVIEHTDYELLRVVDGAASQVSELEIVAEICKVKSVDIVLICSG